jgi:threonyl-tRNA synthetase
MNCPCHVQIFNVGLKSYRDLPLRMAEFGSCARYEPSGALHGIMRVRGFTQDDAHIFCRWIRSSPKPKKFIAFLSRSTATWGFDKCSRSSCPPAPKSASGSDEIWDKMPKAALANATRRRAIRL